MTKVKAVWAKWVQVVTSYPNVAAGAAVYVIIDIVARVLLAVL